MAFFRQYIAPLIAVVGFLIALFFASARIFLPSDMAAPAPVEVPARSTDDTASLSEPTALVIPEIPASLSALTKGLPVDLSS
jgi:hypothetical protein